MADSTVIPVIAEELIVGKRTVEKDRTRIARRVKREHQVVDEPLIRKNYDVKRVPVNRVVDAPEQPRTEGETLILPVYEEQVIIEKRLVLVEELHVTRRVDEIHEPREFELLKEEITIERTGAEGQRV